MKTYELHDKNVCINFEMANVENEMQEEFLKNMTCPICLGLPDVKEALYC